MKLLKKKKDQEKGKGIKICGKEKLKKNKINLGDSYITTKGIEKPKRKLLEPCGLSTKLYSTF